MHRHPTAFPALSTFNNGPHDAQFIENVSHECKIGATGIHLLNGEFDWIVVYLRRLCRCAFVCWSWGSLTLRHKFLRSLDTSVCVLWPPNTAARFPALRP